VIEYLGVDFDAVLDGDGVETAQILPIDLAIVGLLSSRSLLPFRTGVEVAHIGITTEFTDGMQTEYFDPINPLLLGKVAIDDQMLLDVPQMGLDFTQVRQIGIDQGFFGRRGIP